MRATKSVCSWAVRSSVEDSRSGAQPIAMRSRLTIRTVSRLTSATDEGRSGNEPARPTGPSNRAVAVASAPTAPAGRRSAHATSASQTTTPTAAATTAPATEPLRTDHVPHRHPGPSRRLPLYAMVSPSSACVLMSHVQRPETARSSVKVRRSRGAAGASERVTTGYPRRALGGARPARRPPCRRRQASATQAVQRYDNRLLVAPPTGSAVLNLTGDGRLTSPAAIRSGRRNAALPIARRDGDELFRP